jgi:integrase
MSVTVRQKEKGTGNPWYIFIHKNGKIVSKMIGEKRLAETFAAQLRKKMLAGELKLDQQKTPRFDEYAKHYIENHAQNVTKEYTWKGYQRLLDSDILPVLGNLRLDEVTRSDVKQLLISKQRKGLRNGTVTNIKNVISAIFSLALEEEKVTANPATGVMKYIRKPEERNKPKFLTKEQAATLLDYVYHNHARFYPVLLCAFRTGMRMGELMGLAWEDINFEANLIQVRRSYSHITFSSPKNRRCRFIDMSEGLKDALLSHQSKLMQQYSKKLPVTTLPKNFGADNKIRLAFPRADGMPIDLDNFRRNGRFYKILKDANVPDIRFHDIRHTFASLLLQQGEPMHYVKEQMGHASIKTTVDVYGHITPGVNRKAVNKLDDPIKPKLRLVGNAS